MSAPSNRRNFLGKLLALSTVPTVPALAALQSVNGAVFRVIKEPHKVVIHKFNDTSYSKPKSQGRGTNSQVVMVDGSPYVFTEFNHDIRTL